VNEHFPEQEHTREVTMWLAADGAICFRGGSFGQTLELDATEARDLGLALVELADAAIE
jgi:hypothetical protein